jgi:hypothetical protein
MRRNQSSSPKTRYNWYNHLRRGPIIAKDFEPTDPSDQEVRQAYQLYSDLVETGQTVPSHMPGESEVRYVYLTDLIGSRILDGPARLLEGENVRSVSFHQRLTARKDVLTVECPECRKSQDRVRNELKVDKQLEFQFEILAMRQVHVLTVCIPEPRRFRLTHIARCIRCGWSKKFNLGFKRSLGILGSSKLRREKIAEIRASGGFNKPKRPL